MITVFAVVGEHHDDPNRLLLLGADGLHYAHDLPDGPTTPVEPDAAWWDLDETQPALEEVGG